MLGEMGWHRFDIVRDEDPAFQTCDSQDLLIRQSGEPRG